MLAGKEGGEVAPALPKLRPDVPGVTGRRDTSLPPTHSRPFNPARSQAVAGGPRPPKPAQLCSFTWHRRALSAPQAHAASQSAQPASLERIRGTLCAPPTEAVPASLERLNS